MAEAADAASVSRATAYRYFPTQEALLVEIADLSPAIEPVEQLLTRLPPDDVEARLLAVLDEFNRIVFAHEVPMRNALRVYLDIWLENRRKGEQSPPVREGRRMRWLDEIIEPASRELSKAQWRKLRAALALAFSIDALVVMKDVCRLDDDEAQEVLRWTATALLRAGLAQARAEKRRRVKAAA